MPANALKQYLANLPMDVTAAEKSPLAVKHTKDIPNKQRADYTIKLKSHGAFIDDVRRALEDFQASGKSDMADLRSARATVINLRQDVKACDEIAKLYE